MNRYYAVLGLSPTATKEEVRRKYRQLVLQWHPDRNTSPEAHGKFIAITEAYDVLMGERPAPRTKVYSAPAYGTATRATSTKSRAEREREQRTMLNEQLREKFYNMRSTYLRAPDVQKQKKKMYNEAYYYFGAFGVVILLSVLLPLMLIPLGNIVWTMPLALGGGMRLLWTGGRIKMRADMIYSARTDYTMADIQEFFMKSTGFRFESPAGSRRWP